MNLNFVHVFDWGLSHPLTDMAIYLQYPGFDHRHSKLAAKDRLGGYRAVYCKHWMFSTISVFNI